MKDQLANSKKKISIFFICLLLIFSLLPFNGFAEETDGEEEAATTAETTAEEEAATDTEATDENAGDTAADEEEGEVEYYPITATKKVTENANLELYIDEKSGNIRLVNKKSGYEWLGSPLVPTSTLANNKKFMDSPVHITTTDGSSISQTYTLKETGNKLEYTDIENGIRVDFELVEEKLRFAVEYTLTDDGFIVRVPDDSIKEEGTVRLISLEVLPFFNSADEQLDEGAVFLPDGSGALMKVRKVHPKYYNSYSEPVYGPDHTFLEQLGEVLASGFTIGDAPKEEIALPVYGIYQAGKGFLAILTEGEETANINATPAGVRNIPIYRAGPEFVYRSQDVVFIGSSGRIPLFQGKRTEADREVKFILLEDEEAHYVGMAHAYREYLQETAGLEKVTENTTPLHVLLVGGILREEIVGSTFIDMTTFEQAKEIIEKYADAGVESLKITFKGWTKDGLYGNQPEHKAERKLGGKKKLEDLAEFAKKQGVDLYLDANYVRPFNESKGLKPTKDAVRSIDREVTESPNYHVSSRLGNVDQVFYLMRPDHAEEYAKDEIEKYQDLGVSGVHLSYMADMLYSDQNPKHLYTRAQTKESWVKTISLFREKIGKVSVDYGHAYALGHVDEINQIPMDSSHFVILDETVPFYQIVIHGLVPYSGQPSNLRNDSKVELLRMIEYGATPSFELTYKSTDNLKRTMEDRLFSSTFDFWFDRSVEEYNRFKEIHELTKGQLIVGHEQVQNKVYVTTYENGTQVIVNYNRSPKSVDGSVIKALDYEVRKGERR
ncbi:DUF5696 domain-containing protein [Lederbergia graminis]|uniref:DUF5696 domain-containing protein n=1 Tax=Lederbergia graminis TaxID=735518 RepID=A0ABW0LFE1_9BACI